jgi:hypothetical protein
LFEFFTKTYIYAANNKIKFLNWKTFLHIKTLNNVDLMENFCVNETFNDIIKMAILSQTLNRNCSFVEQQPSEMSCRQKAQKEIKSLKVRIKFLEKSESECLKP